MINRDQPEGIRRQCAFQKADGTKCRAAPLHNSQYCLMHSPEHQQQVVEARRMGGLRRKRETLIRQAYEFDTTNNLAGIIRLLQIVVIDTLALDNGVARNRTLLAAIMTALQLYQTSSVEQRVEALEKLAQLKQLPQGKGA